MTPDVSLDVDYAGHACTLVGTTPEVEVTSIGEGNVKLFTGHHCQGIVTDVVTVLHNHVVGRKHVVNEVDRLTSVDGDLRRFEHEVAVETHLDIKCPGRRNEQN